MKESDKRTMMAAPLQGYTDAEWRKAHNEVYGKVCGGADRYFTPFIRMEGGDVRNRDIRGLRASLDDLPDRISAQIIFRDMQEFRMLVDKITATGCRAIDLNLGCPYPMQTRKGRGTAALENDVLLAEVAEEMKTRRDISWSAKIRLGMSDPEAWKKAAPALSAMPLEWITVHPRVAAQGYKGDLHLEEIPAVIDAADCPVLYNGELTTPADVAEVMDRFPGLQGVMLGRGLLARPSLIAECRSGEVWEPTRRMEYIRRMHDIILDGYEASIEGGEHQILSKMMAFWEYLEPEIGHKKYKSLKKSRTLEGYWKVVKG